MMKIIEKIKAKQSDRHGRAPITIACIGDSVTEGCFGCYMDGENIQTVFLPEEAYSERLKKLLHSLYPTVPIYMLNAGISGDKVSGGVARLERDVLTYRPDLVIVSFGLNDCGGGEEGLDTYAQSLRDIFSRVTATGAECIFLTENMMCTHVSPLLDSSMHGWAQMFAKRQKEGNLDLYFDRAKQVAAECGVPVCDCYAKWRAMERGGVNVTSLLANYLNHPIPAMHDLFAQSLLETMFFA